MYDILIVEKQRGDIMNVNEFKVSKLELYSPEDLIALLNTPDVLLTDVANETGIPYPTIKNYCYGKTEPSSMTHRMVVALSDFFRRKAVNQVDLTTLGHVLYTDAQVNWLAPRFSKKGLLMDLYALHELSYRMLSKNEPHTHAILRFSARFVDYYATKVVDYIHFGLSYLADTEGMNITVIWDKKPYGGLLEKLGNIEFYESNEQTQFIVPPRSYFVGNESLNGKKLLDPSIVCDFLLANFYGVDTNLLRALLLYYPMNAHYPYSPGGLARMVTRSEFVESTGDAMVTTLKELANSDDVDVWKSARYSIIRQSVEQFETMYDVKLSDITDNYYHPNSSYNVRLLLEPLSERLKKNNTLDKIIQGDYEVLLSAK